MRRSVQIASAEHQARLPGGFRWQAKFVTLTYAKVGDWKPSHVRDYLDRLRAWLRVRRIELRYVWVAELQRRGAVHYHLVIWVPFGFDLVFPDKAWRDGRNRLQPPMWPYGMSNVQNARYPVAYLTKYASKGTPDGQRFPVGLRTHGCGGLGKEGRTVRAFHMLPAWLRKAAGGVVQRVEKLKGGLYRLDDTGELVRTPWEVIETARDWSWIRLRWRGFEVVAGADSLQTP